MGNLTEFTDHNRQLASAQLSTRLPALQREKDITDLVPVNRAEFAAAVAPCLQLVAPMGMSGEAQEAWLEAAFVALKGIPIGPLKRGAEAAMGKADHPAKIVPAIMAAAKEDWEWRKRYAQPRPQPTPLPWRPSDEERREVGEMIGDLLKRLGDAP